MKTGSGPWTRNDSHFIKIFFIIFFFFWESKENTNKRDAYKHKDVRHTMGQFRPLNLRFYFYFVAMIAMMMIKGWMTHNFRWFYSNGNLYDEIVFSVVHNDSVNRALFQSAIRPFTSQRSLSLSSALFFLNISFFISPRDFFPPLISILIVSLESTFSKIRSGKTRWKISLRAKRIRKRLLIFRRKFNYACTTVSRYFRSPENNELLKCIKESVNLK